MVLKDFWNGFPDKADTSAIDLVLYFAEEAENPGRKLYDVLTNALPEIRFEVFLNCEGLVTSLKRPEALPVAVVLVISNYAELEEFLPLRPALQNTRVILVLPGETGKITALAQRLSPYYVKSADDDFIDLASIIAEILKERRISATGGETFPPNLTFFNVSTRTHTCFFHIGRKGSPR
jgi:hypothetical protein